MTPAIDAPEPQYRIHEMNVLRAMDAEDKENGIMVRTEFVSMYYETLPGRFV